jgi:hypothetical protein
MKTKESVTKNMNEVVFSIDFSFEHILNTLLESFFQIYDNQSLIRDVCSKIDFDKFKKLYCESSKCGVEPYFLYIYQYSKIEDLIDEWNFDTDKFNREVIVSFKREKSIDNVLNRVG